MTPHAPAPAAPLAALLLATTAAVAPAQDWAPVPLISREIRDAGVTLGGEGGQIVRAIVTDSQTGDFAIFGTDVGGLYRTLDGGRTWEPCNVGYWPRGTAGMAIDPHNPDRVLSIGANSVVFDHHGVWLSTDRAASWRSVLPLKMSGSRDRREQLAFDPSTFDPQRNLTTDVYWSRIDNDQPMWGKADSVPAMYKSTDGGATWTQLPDSAAVAGGIVKVHPAARGVVYVANRAGLWRSDDAAASFTLIREGHTTGLDVSAARPESVWITTPDAALRSDDRGQTWHDLNAGPLQREGYLLRHIKVSPVDPARAVLLRDDADGYDEAWFVTHDGGRNWRQSTIDSTLAFLPCNERWSHAAWHPRDRDVLINNGGDWPTRSTDGGLTYHWSAPGVNAVLVGSSFNFNPHHPQTLFVGSQDYNGAVTHDAGFTWTYTNVSGLHWGGYTYGGVAISPTTLVVAKSGSWSGSRQLTVSHDGGATWADVPDAVYADRPNPDLPRGVRVAFVDPADPAVAFCGPFRTADGGSTWQRMAHAHGVFTGIASPRTLFATGVDPETDAPAVLQSTDGGATWAAVIDGPADDVAFDPQRRTLYVAQREKGLLAFDLDTKQARRLDVPRDQLGSWRVRSVAVDPHDPAVVYVAQNKDVYSSTAALSRSTDAGQTWQVLTRATPLDGAGRDGGREAYWVRVHPTTREAWVATGCYGIWKVPPPASP